MAVTKWKPYLQQKEFSILTDHRSLLHLDDHQIHQPMQQKAFLKLMGLNYRLVYRKGHENKAADALSRPCTTENSYAISVSTPKWLEIIVQGYQEDPQAKQLLTELSIASPNSQGFALVDGFIKHKGKI
jgi:hypothetical protein